ncbi:UNVERIFIED_CONTAM: Retrovirus-related Pol polyprotein from transposon TNT 1-94 [Sesamum latifolium]|uniref:Retrovirus-related Pol polyprotein from transposon TNT 1-94 n=1 Tax=Sesamum latifolium TaxID=2727402 RepID=A0AAW2WB52_9LAMI
MEEEIHSIEKNDTWELATLPSGHEAIGVKWVYKIKRNAKGEVERHKARLVAKGYKKNMAWTMKKSLLRCSLRDNTVVGRSQEAYAREILKKFKMMECNPLNTPIECGVKLSKDDGARKVDSTIFRSLVGSLRYLTCTRPDILFAVALVSLWRIQVKTHECRKEILRYLKGTFDYGTFYTSSNDACLKGYCDSDYAGDVDDCKSTTGFVFLLWRKCNFMMLKEAINCDSINM